MQSILTRMGVEQKEEREDVFYLSVDDGGSDALHSSSSSGGDGLLSEDDDDLDLDPTWVVDENEEAMKREWKQRQRQRELLQRRRIIKRRLKEERQRRTDRLAALNEYQQRHALGTVDGSAPSVVAWAGRADEAAAAAEEQEPHDRKRDSLGVGRLQLSSEMSAMRNSGRGIIHSGSTILCSRTTAVRTTSRPTAVFEPFTPGTYILSQEQLKKGEEEQQEEQRVNLSRGSPSAQNLLSSASSSASPREAEPVPSSSSSSSSSSALSGSSQRGIKLNWKMVIKRDTNRGRRSKTKNMERSRSYSAGQKRGKTKRGTRIHRTTSDTAVPTPSEIDEEARRPSSAKQTEKKQKRYRSKKKKEKEKSSPNEDEAEGEEARKKEKGILSKSEEADRRGPGKGVRLVKVLSGGRLRLGDHDPNRVKRDSLSGINPALLRDSAALDNPYIAQFLKERKTPRLSAHAAPADTPQLERGEGKGKEKLVEGNETAEEAEAKEEVVRESDLRQASGEGGSQERRNVPLLLLTTVSTEPESSESCNAPEREESLASNPKARSGTKLGMITPRMVEGFRNIVKKLGTKGGNDVESNEAGPRKYSARVADEESSLCYSGGGSGSDSSESEETKRRRRVRQVKLEKRKRCKRSMSDRSLHARSPMPAPSAKHGSDRETRRSVPGSDTSPELLRNKVDRLKTETLLSPLTSLRLSPSSSSSSSTHSSSSSVDLRVEEDERRGRTMARRAGDTWGNLLARFSPRLGRSGPATSTKDRLASVPDMGLSFSSPSSPSLSVSKRSDKKPTRTRSDGKINWDRDQIQSVAPAASVAPGKAKEKHGSKRSRSLSPIG